MFSMNIWNLASRIKGTPCGIWRPLHFYFIFSPFIFTRETRRSGPKKRWPWRITSKKNEKEPEQTCVWWRSSGPMTNKWALPQQNEMQRLATIRARVPWNLNMNDGEHCRHWAHLRSKLFRDRYSKLASRGSSRVLWTLHARRRTGVPDSGPAASHSRAVFF